MRPIPIPKHVIARAEAEGWESKVIGAPDDDLTSDIRPVDALVGLLDASEVDSKYARGSFQVKQYHMLIQLDDEDCEILAANGNKFWLSFTGSVVPFSMACYLEHPPTGQEEDTDA